MRACSLWVVRWCILLDVVNVYLYPVGCHYPSRLPFVWYGYGLFFWCSVDCCLWNVPRVNGLIRTFIQSVVDVFSGLWWMSPVAGDAHTPRTHAAAARAHRATRCPAFDVTCGVEAGRQFRRILLPATQRGGRWFSGVMAKHLTPAYPQHDVPFCVRCAIVERWTVRA
jgi:hypothetical protein